MMDLEFLQGLIRTMDESGLDHLEIERGGTRIRISKSPPVVAASAASPASAPPIPPGSAPSAAPTGATGSGAAETSSEVAAVEASNLVEITSPMVGTFYRAPAPDAPSYVDVGSTIGQGDTLCIIEAMKLMNELEAEISGRVAEICVENAEPVEFGQVLFRVEPT